MKRKTILFLLIFIAYNNAIAEQSLMRLFYTPAERAIIDMQRHVVKKDKQVKPSSLEQTERIEVKGFMKRSGQPDVVWVNNNNTLKSNKPLSDVKVLKVHPGGKVKLRVRGKGIVKLKPGQVITRSQQPVREAYEKH